jgi:predicted O-methyltransferase YrrM
MTVDVHFDIIDGISYTWVNGIKGTLTENDTKILLTYASTLDENCRYVETGSYLGCSSVLVALGSKATVWAHDIWVDNWSELEGTIPPLETENYFLKFYEGVLANKLENRIIPIRGKSGDTLKIHPLKSIDLAFIDGDHSYHGCFSDLELMYPRMKPGTVMLVHDCWDNSECYLAVADFARKHSLRWQRASATSGLARIPVPELDVPLDGSA